MTLAIAYGYELNARDLGKLDTSDEKVMEKFLGKDTMLLYMSYENIQTFNRRDKPRKKVLLVTAYDRSRHDFAWFLVLTESFISNDKLGKTIPHPTVPDSILDKEMDDLIYNIRTKGEGVKECPVPFDADPVWIIIDSDD